MSGSYMGKNWSNIEYFLDLYDIEEKRTTIYILKMYEAIIVEYRVSKAEKKRKADERRASASGGKNFTHNVKG